MLRFSLVLFILLNLSPIASAEDVTIHLKTGEELTGRLIEVAPDHVTVDLGSGKATRFARSSVEKLDRDEGDKASFEAPADEPPSAAASSPMSEAMRVATMQSLMTERAAWVDKNTSTTAPVIMTILGTAATAAAVILLVSYVKSRKTESVTDYSVVSQCPQPSGLGPYYTCYLHDKDVTTSNESLKTASIFTGVGAVLFVGAATVLWAIRTSQSTQLEQLERIDGRLKELGTHASISPWFTPRTQMAGTSGGLRLSLQF